MPAAAGEAGMSILQILMHMKQEVIASEYLSPKRRLLLELEDIPHLAVDEDKIRQFHDASPRH